MEFLVELLFEIFGANISDDVFFAAPLFQSENLSDRAREAIHTFVIIFRIVLLGSFVFGIYELFSKSPHKLIAIICIAVPVAIVLIRIAIVCIVKAVRKRRQ